MVGFVSFACFIFSYLFVEISDFFVKVLICFVN